MRGVIGLAAIIVGASMAWLIIIGKFPPQPAGTSPSGSGLLSVLKDLQNHPVTDGSGAPGTGLATVGKAGAGAVKGS